MKKIITSILSVLIVFTLVGCAERNANVIDMNNEITEDESMMTDEEKDKKYRGYVENTDVFVELAYDELNTICNDEQTGFTGIILLGREGCPWCRRLVPVIYSMVKNKEISPIYYTNTTKAKETELYKTFNWSDFSKIESIGKLLVEDGSVNENGEPSLSVPTLFAFKNGTPIAVRSGTVENDSLDAPLTYEQRVEITNGIKALESLTIE